MTTRKAKRWQQKDDEPEKGVDVRKHKAKEIRRLCNLLSDQFSDGRNVSARQVLDALEQFWGECRAELMKGRE